MEREGLVLLKRLFESAKEHLNKNDPVQGSEKIYKVTENCLKLLAENYNLPEFEEAKKEGTWWTKLLGRTATTLAKKLKEEKFNQVWEKAFDIHRHGFHESAYTVEDIEQKGIIPLTQWLINYTEETIRKGREK